MSRISIDGGVAAAAESTGHKGALSGVEADEFLKLLLAELSNQDPLDPMDNVEMLQQINQIREISATDHLSSTLAAVLMGQDVATASSLIGKRISALSIDGKNVEGIVDRVSIEKDDTGESPSILRVHIGEDAIELDNLREILAE
jgi:flagellar basal-body rod modification protein FlgD